MAVSPGSWSLSAVTGSSGHTVDDHHKMSNVPNDKIEATEFYRRDPRTVNWLPFDVFWDVTRRHTYYLACWKEARDDGPATREERIRARQLLQYINVTLEPVDPAVAAAEIGKRQVAGGFQRGAVLPMTFRSIFALLLTGPPEVRTAARALLLKTIGIDPSTDQGSWKLNSALNEEPRGSLDALVPGLHFTLNPAASQRAMVEGMTNVAKAMKASLKIPENRRRLPEIAAYIDVWDQREGWMNTVYELNRERTLKEIGAADGTAHSTLVSRYKAGFELITGHRYSPEKWFRIFGIVKTQQIAHANRTPVESDSATGSQLESIPATGVCSPSPMYQNAASLWALANQIQREVALKRSDQEIAQVLGLGQTETVAFLRSRLTDGLFEKSSQGRSRR